MLSLSIGYVDLSLAQAVLMSLPEAHRPRASSQYGLSTKPAVSPAEGVKISCRSCATRRTVRPLAAPDQVEEPERTGS
jgi:hypothetical protein